MSRKTNKTGLSKKASPPFSADPKEASKMGFEDGIRDVRSLINRRNIRTNTTYLPDRKLTNQQLEDLYTSNTLLSTIIDKTINSAYANGIQFEDEDDFEKYSQALLKQVHMASKFMLYFGRGSILISDGSEDLSKPLRENLDFSSYSFKAFTKTELRVNEDVSRNMLDLNSFLEPRSYHLQYIISQETQKSSDIHYSRVVDFNYRRPVLREISLYNYGGIPFTEELYDDIINYEIINRASINILEKSSTLVYKLEGFSEKLMRNKAKFLQEYMGFQEDLRSIYGAILTDKENDVTTLSQSLSNFKDTADGVYRQLGMISNLGATILLGDGKVGLNNSNDNEMELFYLHIKSIQTLYLSQPINKLMSKVGLSKVTFREPEKLNDNEKQDMIKKVLENAKMSSEIGYVGEVEIRNTLKEAGVIGENTEEGALNETFKSDDESGEL